ncbi:MAG: CARDB domain-containing protein, partial [Planctomycetota bacterium]
TQASFFQYLDSDLLWIDDDVLKVTGSVLGQDLILSTIDPATSAELAQSLGGAMANAIPSGFAADQYPELRWAIQAGGYDAAQGGTIDTVDLPFSFKPGIGNAYGPEDITTAIEYTFTDPDSAVITTVLGLANVPITVPDLVVPNVSAAPFALIGQPLTVSWTVENRSLIDALNTAWPDFVYLSTDDVFDINNDINLGVFTDVGGGLAGGDSYTMTETIPTAAMAPGEYYVLVVTDQPNLVDEAPMEFNNVGVTASPVRLVEPLALDVPTPGVLAAAGDALYFGVTVPAGEHLEFALDDLNDQGLNELSLGYEMVPTRLQYDAQSPADRADQSVFIADTQAGTYLVMVYGIGVPDAPGDFTIVASLKDFGIRDVTPDSGGNAGSVTVSISGYRLTPNTTAALDDGAGTVIPGTVVLVNTAELLTTFDLLGAPAGAYDVILSDPASPDAMLDDGFNVFDGGQADLQVRVDAPTYLRQGRPGRFLVTVENAGNLDAPLPWLGVSVDGPQDAWSVDQTVSGQTDFELLARPDGHLIGALAPGQSVQFALEVQNVDPAGGLSVAFLDEGSVPAGEAVDWTAVRQTMPNPLIGDPDGDAAWADMIADLGATWGEVLGALRARAVAAGDALAPIDALLNDAFAEYLAQYTPNVLPDGETWQWDDLTGFLAPMETGGVAVEWNVVTVGGGTEVVGPAGTNGYLLPDTVMSYSVFFEYDPYVRPAPPAREVTVTTVLDGDLDLGTFELTHIAFGDHLINVPPGLSD